MKLWKWQPGRQKDVAYEKFCLWSFKLFRWAFDGYILRYQPDTFLPLHKDLVENGKHWRLNVKLRGKSIFFSEDRGHTSQKVNWFRPDLYRHSLSVYTETVKLSFGFVKFYT